MYPFRNICTLLKEPNYIIIEIHPVTYVFFNRLSQAIMFLDFGRNVNISGLIYTKLREDSMLTFKRVLAELYTRIISQRSKL